MNRIEATKNIGNTVLVDKGAEGIYYGSLVDVFAPPKKTWSGRVYIVGMAASPALPYAEAIYENKNVHLTISGSKIHLSDQEWNMSFDESVVHAVQSTMNDLHKTASENEQLAKKWEEIGSEFGQVSSPFHNEAKTNKASYEDPYVYYQIQRANGSVSLIEPQTNDELELEGCPFDFEIHPSGSKSWIPVSHHELFTFIDKEEKTYKLKDHEWVRIHKDQFHPFNILLNELEPPARHSLLRDIRSFGFERSDLADCHNHLLYELLQAEGTTSFQGVNFITFQKPGKTLFIQHHYKRKLYTQRPDYVFDRFESTTDLGNRSISTYTNAYSKDRNS